MQGPLAGLAAYCPPAVDDACGKEFFEAGTLQLKPRATTPPAFKTRRDIERYFGGKTIECLFCGQRFRRLGGHLAAKHEMSVDEYRTRFGLPWTRGLTSAALAASSGWTDKRKAKARRLARINRFFERAHLTRRRAPAPFLKTEAIQNLGKHAVGFGKAFERRVRALFDKGPPAVHCGAPTYFPLCACPYGQNLNFPTPETILSINHERGIGHAHNHQSQFAQASCRASRTRLVTNSSTRGGTASHSQPACVRRRVAQGNRLGRPTRNGATLLAT